ncbi:hypothetical protein DSL72_001124 [Monilinia vaccinii-corymbosi]|uniref:Uncharacterized protein n=1 Tax=Monilinia vaccinii-corymbosi TaxID=61207 RepID=A0A8A3PAI4_9HELO|nr:hypothetical protein DSL72_001124 [Monilinia vaccinii-corymbosi]
MPPRKQHRRLSAFPTIAEHGERTPTSSAPSSSVKGLRRTPFLEHGPTEVSRGRIPEDQIQSWLDQRDDFVNTSEQISRMGALRLLFTNRNVDSNKKAVGMTFSHVTLQMIIARLQLPAAFAQMLAPDQMEPPRFSHNTLFDTHSNHLGMAIAIHYRRWRLESLTLGISYNQTTKVTTALLLENSKDPTYESFIHHILSQSTYLTHPLFLPLILAELMLDTRQTQLDRTTSRLRNLESAIGIHHHDDQSSPSPSHATSARFLFPDFPFLSRSLNGESTHLALYEVEVRSNIHLLQALLRDPHFTTTPLPINRRMAWMDQASIALREKGEFLLAGNVELSVRAAGQRRIAKILIGSVQNLLTRRESKTTASTLKDRRRGDANSIKTIAVLLMAFLPGAYVALLFSGSMFDWHAQHWGGVLSEWFWLYWAITGPLTAVVLGACIFLL